VLLANVTIGSSNMHEALLARLQRDTLQGRSDVAPGQVMLYKQLPSPDLWFSMVVTS
jgi:hypothetical protein